MRNLILWLSPILLFAFKPTDDCPSSYRWDNKIMIDAKGLSLFHKTPGSSTMNTVVHYTKPPNNQLGANRGSIESKKVTVTALLIGLGKERDQDYHLILCSTNHKDSMIAEIPDPDCPKLNDFIGLRERFSKARQFIKDNVDDTPGGIHYLPDDKVIKVKVTGMLFFDKKAHGNGHARNDIEIHPVLKIVKAN